MVPLEREPCCAKRGVSADAKDVGKYQHLA